MHSKLSTRRVGSSGRRVALLLKRYIVAVGGLTYGFSVGLRKSRHRALVGQVATHFGFRGVIPGRLPTVAIDAVTKPSTPVVIPAARSQDGNVSELELLVIARLVAERAPRTIVEIGTFDGRTTVALSANAPENASVLTLDLPAGAASELPIERGEAVLIDKPQSGTRYIGTPYAAKIRQLYGDSATHDFGPLEIDFAFIDGSHSYEYALSDSRRMRALLRNGRGLIVWHDYGVEWEGVTKALDELREEAEFSRLAAIEGTTLAILDLS